MHYIFFLTKLERKVIEETDDRYQNKVVMTV